jgi:homoserine trans-succinylase
MSNESNTTDCIKLLDQASIEDISIVFHVRSKHVYVVQHRRFVVMEREDNLKREHHRMNTLRIDQQVDGNYQSNSEQNTRVAHAR